MHILRAIMLGDVVGDPGLDALDRQLPLLIKENSVDFVVVNGENAASGFGLTLPHLERIFAAGADVVTSGNHVWEKRDFLPVLDSQPRILRPLNYPPGNAGKGFVTLEKPSSSGVPVTWAAVNIQGREFMSPIDCPFRAFDSLVWAENNGEENAHNKPIILVDFHAESTREKEAFGFYLDGRASVVAGTHTHVQTSDERILPGGTAYITDLGMCGNLDSVIGMDTQICLNRARNQVLYRMEVAVPTEDDRVSLQGILVEFDGGSKKAVSIRRL